MPDVAAPRWAGRAARRVAVIGTAAAACGTALAGIGTSAPTAATVPPIGHVFVIVLENESFAKTFGNPSPPATQTYLDRTLPSMGVLLTQYYGTGHVSNDNYVAMVSGQAPNPQNQGDCPLFDDLVPLGMVAPDQVEGTGCVFPASVPTIGNQLTAAGLSWKDYDEDMGNIPLRDGGTTCGHPIVDTPDITQLALPGDGYATRHNPFVYFHSVIDDSAYCGAHVVPLGSSSGSGSGLAADLASASTTPNLSFIVPDLCDDGHDPAIPSGSLPSLPVLGTPSLPVVSGCTNESSPGGPTAASAFLSTWVPRITSSPAFAADGMLVVLFDEASTTDSTACCGETPGPNSPKPGITGPGGGRTGAVVVSPFTLPGTTSSTPYNHYSLLASLENIFGLGRLGMAQTVTTTFGSDVYSAP